MTPDGPVTLHPAGPGDVATVRAMETDPDTLPWIGEVSPSWHAARDAEHLLARRDGVLVGFAVLAGPRGTETGVELRRLVVAAEHRGHGHGRAVLRAVLSRLTTRGVARVWLDVLPGNDRARALYESEGFTVERDLPADPRDPEGPVARTVLAYSAGSSERPS